MARTHTNLNGVGDGSPGDTWNVRNFATAVKINVSPTTFIICMVYSLHTRLNPLFDQYPSINWKSVIQSLDYEHFLLYDSTGLEMLVQAWREWTEVRIMMFVFFQSKRVNAHNDTFREMIPSRSSVSLANGRTSKANSALYIKLSMLHKSF
jgi:hypothetical protein